MTSSPDPADYFVGEATSTAGDTTTFDISNALNTLSSLQSPDFMEDSAKLPSMSMAPVDNQNDVVKLGLTTDESEETKTQATCSSTVTNYYFPNFPNLSGMAGVPAGMPGMPAMPCMPTVPAMPMMPGLPAMPAMPAMPPMPLSSSVPVITGTPLQDFAQQWQMQQQQQAAMCWWWQMWMQQMYSNMSAFTTPQNMQEMMQQYQAMFSNSQQYQNMFNSQQYQQWMQQATAMQTAMQNSMQAAPNRLPTPDLAPPCQPEPATAETPSEATSSGKRAREASSNAQAASNQNMPKRGRRATKEQKVCKNCGTKSTPFWRKDKHDGRPLCNACGLYFSKNDMPRPKILWKSDDLALAAAGLIDLPPQFCTTDCTLGACSSGCSPPLCGDSMQQPLNCNGGGVSRSSSPGATYEVLDALPSLDQCLTAAEGSSIQGVGQEQSALLASPNQGETSPTIKRET